MSTFSEITERNSSMKSMTKRINGVPVEIKLCIDIDTFGNIVQTVAKSCFQGGEYRAENREIANRFAILKYLTDIEVDEDKIADIFVATQCGNWYADIYREVTKSPLWGEIDLAIDKQVEYIISTRPTAFDNLCSDLSDIIKVGNSGNFNELKEIFDALSKVDQKAFVKEVIDQNIAKNKGGDKNGKKSKRTTKQDSPEEG